jgi:hypothetical protein
MRYFIRSILVHAEFEVGLLAPVNAQATGTLEALRARMTTAPKSCIAEREVKMPFKTTMAEWLLDENSLRLGDSQNWFVDVLMPIPDARRLHGRI